MKRAFSFKFLTLAAALLMSQSGCGENSNVGGGGASGLVFVSNQTEESISVIDAGSNTIVDTIEDLEGLPTATVFGTNGKAYVAFVTEEEEPGIAVVNTFDGSIEQTVFFEGEGIFTDIDLSPNGATLACSLVTELAAGVVFFETTSNEFLEEGVELSGIVLDIEYSNDNRTLYAASISGVGFARTLPAFGSWKNTAARNADPLTGFVFQIDTLTGDGESIPYIAGQPVALGLSADEEFLYVLLTGSGAVGLERRQTDDLELDDSAALDYFGLSFSVAPATNTGYLTGIDEEDAVHLVSINLDTLTVGPTALIDDNGDSIFGVHAINGSGTTAFVHLFLDGADATVTPVDLATMTAGQSIAVGEASAISLFLIHTIAAQ